MSTSSYDNLPDFPDYYSDDSFQESIVGDLPEDDEDDAVMSFMKEFDSILENYYRFHPDTLMPLLLMALATRGKLGVIETRESKPGVYRTLDIDEIYGKRQWVTSNPQLTKRLKRCLNEGIHFLDVCMELDTETASIYSYFKEHDEVTVVREYHQRIGVLADHKKVDQQMRIYALILFVEFLTEHRDLLSDNFIELYDKVLVTSGLQPARPRLDNARLLCRLLEYSGEGYVYNPFAGISFAGAMLNAGNRMYADGDDPRITAAGQVLNYGVGGNNLHFVKHDSKQWINDVPFECVVSTYRGVVDDRPALCFCLDKFLNTDSATGKYAGIIKSDDLFDQRCPEVERAISMDVLDKIVVLPYNETALLFDKNKKDKGVVKLYDALNGFFAYVTADEILDDPFDSVKLLSTKSLIRSKFNLRRYVVCRVDPIDGQEIVSVRRFLKKIPKRMYDTSKLSYREKAMLHFDDSTPYDYQSIRWGVGLLKTPSGDIYNPVYKLDHDSLIVKSSGLPEPRLFDSDNGAAYFDEGLAFGLRENPGMGWLINELKSPYVERQLHPYGVDRMIPNEITEDRFLALKLYRPVMEDEEEDENSQYLKPGYVLHNLADNRDYEILGNLGQGGCGITYNAIEKDLANGATREVALKECYLYRHCHRDGVKVEVDDFLNFMCSREDFINEAKVMMKFGAIKDCHIVPALSYFDSEETGTSYYVMNLYPNGSLDSFMKLHPTFEESFMINNVVKPLAKAIHYVHADNKMHLDIKPDNILIDDSYEAALTDFGLIKEYDEDGNLISSCAMSGTKCFAAPEQMFKGVGHALVRFAPPTDVYGLAATLFHMMTRRIPHSVMDFSDQDVDIREALNMCSKQTQDAIVAGLQNSAVARPQTIQEFLNMFPGCEDIVL